MIPFALALVAVCQTAPKEESVAEKMLREVNQLRTERKLPPLKLDERLNEMAEFQCSQMAEIGRISHKDNSGRGVQERIELVKFPYKSAGENVASGHRDVASVVATWMKTDGHRRNMLGADYTHMGVGRVASKSGRLYWCQTFGELRD